MYTILLLEDEDALRRGIRFKLEKDGYHVIACSTIHDASRKFLSQTVHLILCDIMLPDGSGLDFCKYIREELQSSVQFIFLTAMDTELDIVMGYETGADDYITKPFSLAVLMSKVHSVFKRIENLSLSRHAKSAVIRSGRLTYCPGEMQLLVDGQPVELTRNEYRLLQLFLSHPKQILYKKQILEQMFDSDGNFVDDNTVAVNIRRLREKINDTAEKRIIKNIRGMGYVWDYETEQV